MVLADKQVNGHRKGLAFSALPDAPVLAPTAARRLAASGDAHRALGPRAPDRAR